MSWPAAKNINTRARSHRAGHDGSMPASLASMPCGVAGAQESGRHKLGVCARQRWLQGARRHARQVGAAGKPATRASLSRLHPSGPTLPSVTTTRLRREGFSSGGSQASTAMEHSHATIQHARPCTGGTAPQAAVPHT